MCVRCTCVVEIGLSCGVYGVYARARVCVCVFLRAYAPVLSLLSRKAVSSLYKLYNNLLGTNICLVEGCNSVSD